MQTARYCSLLLSILRHNFLAPTLTPSNHKIVQGGSSLGPPSLRLVIAVDTYRCIDTWKKLVSYIQVSVYPSEYRRSIFGGDRRGRSSKRGSETKGERTVARSVFSLPVELYLHGVTCPINREHYSPVDGLRIRDGARITPGYIYTRVRI